MAFPVDLDAIARGEVSDDAIRKVLRFGVTSELRRLQEGGPAGQLARKERLIQSLMEEPIAVATDEANRQHYEIPPEFFRLVLGKRMKYSCALWSGGVTVLDAAEEAMLDAVCKRAGLQDGQRVLDLGCGWGALSLYIAERYPACHVLALSNSQAQKIFIEASAGASGIQNLQVETGNIASWETAQRFDRILSIEMFEHMRNYDALLARLAAWLAAEGKLFVHVFSHRSHAYKFDGSWMAERFFTGGLMPSDDLLPHFQRHVCLLNRWRLDGTHYQKTCEAWLGRLDANRRRALVALVGAGLDKDTTPLRLLTEFRLFFMTCAEAFGYAQGQEWGISHYLFGSRS
jgi:cyclopropane-fatty-acyl-phospholipid synthase